MLYGHGDDGYRFTSEIIADFSTNVWYGGEPEGLKEHIFKNWAAINKYPEVLGESLTEKIAAYHHLQPDNILVNNGSTESIYLIAQAFGQSETTIVTPTFSEYEDAAGLYGHKVSYIDWNNLQSASKIKADILFICNPNNPTGEVFSGIEELLDNNPETIFVVDEAFIEFTLSVSSAIALINKYANLIILRSLTKAYAIPGLRLGYIAAAAALVNKIKLLKFPWSVNTIALETGKFIFDNYAAVQIPLESLLKQKAEFIAALQKTPVKINNSHTHFFLSEVLNGKASALKKYLLDNYGILIRDASNFRGLREGHFRVATLSAHKNQLLVNALKEWNSQFS
jgi:threonine-phosphate decarboxylase